MTKRLLLRFSPTIALILVLAACGGGGDGDGSPTSVSSNMGQDQRQASVSADSFVSYGGNIIAATTDTAEPQQTDTAPATLPEDTEAVPLG